MKTMNVKLLLMLMLFAISIASCTNNQEEHKHTEQHTYTCPMHPDVVQHEMGTCPICKMDLVLVNKNGAKNNELMLNEEQLKLANIKTLKLNSGEFNSSRTINGMLEINPLATKIISSRFAGRIEELYFKETGLNIKKGQKLFTIYSEELLTLQKDFLLNIKQKESFPNESIYVKLADASRKKLALYGYSNNQINQLERSKKTNARITVFAQESGTIKEINISEGQYITEGSPAFVLEDLGTLWLTAQVYPNEAKDIKVGQKLSVLLSGFENETISARVEYIDPQVQANSQIINIRASIANHNQRFWPGMFASIAMLKSSESDIIKLPINAVIRDEMHNEVWIRTGNNTFEPRYVDIADESEHAIVISKGLSKGDEVVISGAYLLYSEHKLKN